MLLFLVDFCGLCYLKFERLECLKLILELMIVIWIDLFGWLIGIVLYMINFFGVLIFGLLSLKIILRLDVLMIVEFCFFFLELVILVGRRVF